MAGQSRTLKLSILADVDQLKKSLNQANDDVDHSSNRMGDFSKKAGLAFAAAGIAAAAYAVKIGVDGVKAAIEDEAAQVRLATALKAATGATDEMIASVEKQILQTSLATGVADDKLRPALQRLSLSTNDVTKAQDLLNLALDISQATGKDLDGVANALGKAYDGNTAALGKLGVGLSSAELKAMTFTEVQGKLSDLFGGAAAANAETFEGRIARLKVAFDEGVETIGFALLPILQKFIDLITQFVLPIVQSFSDALSSKKEGGLASRINEVVAVVQSYAMPIFDGLVKVFNKVKDAITANKDSFESFFEVVKYIAPIIGKVIGGALSIIGDIAGVVIGLFSKVLSAIKPILDFAINAANQIIKVMNAILPGKDTPLIPGIGSPPAATGKNPIQSGTFLTPSVVTPTVVVPKVTNTATAVAAVAAAAGLTGSSGGTNGVAGAGTTDSQNAARLIAEAAARGGGFTDSQNATRLAAAVAAAPVINVTVNGAIDSEGTSRTIVNTLNDSFFRGTGGGNNLMLVK